MIWYRSTDVNRCVNRSDMDLRGLEGIQWRGFSDREIQQLQYRRDNTKKVSKGKLDEVKAPRTDYVGDDQVCDKEDDHRMHCASNEQKERPVEEDVNKQAFSATPTMSAKDESDSSEKYEL